VKQILLQKSGSIVNISTTLVGHANASARAAVQIMIKGGLDAVTRALAIEHAHDGIRGKHRCGRRHQNSDA
jgi:NAD(P)-dependent dehydrogenase (short-subunit alcohol dehydrogenase family)